jgi:hypothetical protein
MRARLGILVVTVLALAGGACSDDGGGGGDLSSEEVYIDAVVAAVEDDEDSLFTPGATDPECIVSGWVAVIGLDRLEGAGIEPEDFRTEGGPDMAALELDEDEADDLYDTFETCGVDALEVTIDEVVADAEDGEAMRSCVESALTEEDLRAMMTSLFRAGADAMDEATASGTLDPEIERALDEMSACISADVFGSDDGGDD